ncbi:MAG: hypothetical protein ACTSUE_18760 [Promethearchaeota archaeon]
MPTIKTSFWLPQWVINGLKKKTYERAGSIIRESRTKQIICWLRDQKFNDDSWQITAVHPFLSMLYSESTLDKLTDEELVGFLRFIHAVPELVNIDFYGGRKSMQSILNKYSRLVMENKKEAKHYAREKRASILRTFNKSFLPQVRFRLTADMLWLDPETMAGILEGGDFRIKGKKVKAFQKKKRKRDPVHEIDVEFDIDKTQARHLKSKKLERVGGILREKKSKKIVTWLQAIKVKIPGMEDGDASYDYKEILLGKQQVDNMPVDQLIALVRWLYKQEVLVKSKYATPLKNALKIVIIHDKIITRDGEKAGQEYANAKRQSMLNLLDKSFLPNVQAAIVRKELKIPT